MQPLYDAPRHLFGKVLFLNDVFFCAHDMVELLYQSDLHQSDMTCGLDYDNTDKGLGFYDTYGYVQVLRMFLYLPNDIEHRYFDVQLHDADGWTVIVMARSGKSVRYQGKRLFQRAMSA